MQFVRIGLFALALAVPPPLLAQEKAADTSADVQKEFDTLVEQYQKDQAEFMKPVSDAKSDDEANKAYEALDQTKNPNVAYLEKFNDLADKAEGTETGARALLFIVSRLRPSADAARRNFNILLDDYIESPVMAEVAPVLGYGIVPPAQAEQFLNRILEECPVKDAKASALSQIAGMRLNAGQTDAAKEMFARLKSEFADSPAAKAASGALFELENLQVGMTVPEIEATDQDGRAFKLSDYKGKVVVIDFWGFW